MVMNEISRDINIIHKNSAFDRELGKYVHRLVIFVKLSSKGRVDSGIGIVSKVVWKGLIINMLCANVLTKRLWAK